MTEFTWYITGMRRRASDGMVYQVDYKVVANRGDYKSSTNGYVRLRESSSPVAFASLTEDLVVGWVKAKMGSVKEQAIYDLLNTELDKKKHQQQQLEFLGIKVVGFQVNK